MCCMFRDAASPAQWDLLRTVLVGVLIAVGAAAVFLRRDVETAHLSSGSGLFHAEQKKKSTFIFLCVLSAPQPYF